MTTWRAPAWRTTGMAMMPMGPAPVMSTSSPSTGNESAVCTALPKGSKMAATSWLIFGIVPPDIGHGQRDQLGKGAGAIDADARVCDAQRWRRPARQLRQRPQTTWPSPLTMSPGKKSLTFEPTSTISSDKLVADGHGHGDGLLRPFVPLVDMHIGAADAGVTHADQHVVDADRRLGNLFQPQSALRFALDQCLHERIPLLQYAQIVSLCVLLEGPVVILGGTAGAATIAKPE